MEEKDKAELQRTETIQDVLRILVTALVALNPQAMPQVARTLRDSTARPGLSVAARAMIWDLADGIDLVTGTNTEV